MSKWELEKWGYFEDTGANDTVEILFRQYYNYQAVSVYYDILTDNIRRELSAGRLVLVPINGQTIGNSYYTGIGPERHMIVVTGFDAQTSLL